jgi:class 3 adenylate cyclase
MLALAYAAAHPARVHLLASITVPTLVVQPSDVAIAPMAWGRELASRIPGAQLKVLKTNVFWSEDIEESMIASIREFLGASSPTPGAPPAASAFRTVLFTDLVDHTDMMQRLGDAKGRDVLRAHERITREVLRLHGGTEVKTDGVSFMVSFGSVTQAVDCAIALQRAFAAHNESMPESLHVRAGLNAGEPIEEDGDYFGSTVILAGRICAKAGAGEILVPEAVRHMLSGKSYVYADRGETLLKGFEDKVRLFEVRWRE